MEQTIQHLALRHIYVFILTLLLMQFITPGLHAQSDDIPEFSFNSPYSNDARFGDVVAIDGNYAVIGSRGQNNLYFYRFTGSNWELMSEINIGHRVTSLAIDQQVVVVGSENAGFTNRGEVKVYRLTEAEGENPEWILEQTFGAFVGGDEPFFGSSVDVKGGTILVGARDAAPEQYGGWITGAANVYQYSSANASWSYVQTLYPSNVTSERNSNIYYGESLSLNEDGTRAIINSFLEEPGSAAGGISTQYSYLYRLSGNEWVEDGMFTYTYRNDVTSKTVGKSASYYGNRVVIGGPRLANSGLERVGIVYQYERLGNNSWSDRQELLLNGRAEGDNFGYQISLTEDYLAVSAPGLNTDPSSSSIDQGGVIIYQRNSANTGWSELTRIENPDNLRDSFYGNSMDFSKDGRLIAGTPNFRSGQGSLIGKAHIHLVVPPTPANFRASDGSQTTSIATSWSSTGGVNGFRLYERGQSGAIETLTNTFATSYTLSQLTPGVAKELGIAAFNGVTESPVAWDIGYTQPNGRLSGTITSQGGGGMPGTRVTAAPIDNPVRYTIFDGEGMMEIPHGDQLNLGGSFTIEAIIRIDEGLDEKRFGIYSTRSENQPGSFQLEAGSGDGGNGRVAVSSLNRWVIQTEDGVIQPGADHHIVYQRTGDLHRIFVDGELVKEETDDVEFLNNHSPKMIGSGTNRGQLFEGRIGEVRLWNRFRTTEQLDRYRGIRLTGSETDLIGYWRLGGELETGAVDWAGANHAYYTNGTVQTDPSDNLPVWGSFTQNDGTYEIRGITYGSGTEYRVQPAFGSNEYDPEFRNRNLRVDQPTQSQIDFTDITTFTVSGTIQFEGTSCFAANVDIYVNNVLTSTTNADGTFSVSILQSGQNVIRPEFGEHTFEPAEVQLNVLSDIDDINFVNTQRRMVDGQVAGGDCRFFIGEGLITATGENQCFTESATTDGQGNYSLDLPALPGLLLEAGVPSNEDITFQAHEISLSDSSLTEDFLYRTAPQISLSGLPAITPCGARVLRQLDSYFVEIEAFEEYESGTCAVNNGTVLIQNQIADRAETDTLSIRNGFAVYDFMAGNPNIVGGGNHPYQKLLSMEVQTGDEQDGQYFFSEVFDEWAIVEGHRPREQTFTTVSPEIPFFILRDPPGDQSYSFLSEEQSVCRTMSMSMLAGAGSTVWAEAKLGTKFQAGLGVSTETEVWASFGSSLSVSATLISQEEVETCLITNQEFTTSDSDAFIGEDGDLYVGAAMNILYALTDVLEYNQGACRVDLSKDIVFGNDGFETEYIYTEGHIRDVIIPDLERIISLPSISADSVAFLANQVDVWRQTLDLNREIKEEARDREPLNNYSISGGAGLAYSITSTVSETKTIEYDLEIESEIAFEAGVEIAGSGVSGGASVRMQAGFGESRTVARSQSNTIGFFLGDDDPGDSFSVNVLSDPVFGTFVFDLAAGVSSCPWEPGTLPRDGAQLTAEELTKVGVPADREASFRLTLGNNGQNNEAREYRLNAIPGSNPDGAVILVNGIPISTLEPYVIPDLGFLDQTLTVRRGPTAFDYENLGILLRSTCDAAIADTVSLTVRFESSCSPMELANVEDGWVVNAGSDNRLPFTVSGYDRSAFNNILLQYSPAGQNSWQTSRLISVNDLPNNSANLNWDVSNIDDGSYDFRVAVQCDAGVSYTTRFTGSIQRGGLLVEGLPQPSDEILNIGDVISVTFNRQLNEASVGDQTTLTATLFNQGAAEESFTFTKTPEWLEPSISSGNLQPGERQLVAFVPDPMLGSGMYRDTVIAETSLGNENLVVEYAIQCEPPAWELDEQAFSNSMNLVASFYVGDVPFSAENDIVAAFVGDELRGVSRVVPTVPNIPGATGYLYTGFVTIYSNQPSGETVTFQLWDAAACRVMDVSDTISFENDAIVGSADDPEKFTITGAMLQSIPVAEGTNWISLGVEATNMSLNNVFSRTRPREGDAVIGQTGFNQFVLGTGWVGTLDSLDPGIMYKLKISGDSSVDLIGQRVDGDDRPINLSQGWNWLGYLPDEALPLSDAVASLTHSSGDVIRSQTAFSQFSGESSSWVGNLNTMSPGAGYKLFRGSSGTLTYPGAGTENAIQMEMMQIASDPGWEVNAADFEQGMAVTGRLTLDGDVVTGRGTILSAWVDGELRGVTRAINVMDQWLYFMNVYGLPSESELNVEFQAWDPVLGLYEQLEGSVKFAPESVAGTPRNPVELQGSLATSLDDVTDAGIPDRFELSQNYPNPFNPTTRINFALPEAADVRLEVYNIIGQRVAVLVNEQRQAGYHNIMFDASHLASGVYLYRIQAGSFTQTQKMMLVK